MTRSARIKFRLLAISNLRSLVTVNLLFLLPCLLFCYSLVRTVPVLLRYVNTLNVSVVRTAEGYDRLAVVVMPPEESPTSKGSWVRESVPPGNERVYVFAREGFRKVRRAVFLNDRETLAARALGTAPVPLSNEPFVVRDREGGEVATVRVENVRSGTVELLFHHARPRAPGGGLRHAILLAAAWVLVAGSLGGINDYTQRIVFHEPKSIGYLLDAVRRYFVRSLVVSLFFSVTIGAVCANIYFYIFIGTVSILNIWTY